MNTKNSIPSAPEKLALIGVPSSAGARRTGQERAPRALRRAGLVEGLRSSGREVVDLGDVDETSYSPDPRSPKGQNLGLVTGVLEQVARAVDSAVAQRAWPLVVGGDCTVTIGVLAALTKRFPDLGLIYFDGDLDLNTPSTTSSGIYDGMVLAHVLGEGSRELSGLGPRHPLLEEPNVALFGYSVRAGGVDPVEIERLRRTRMSRYPLEEVEGRARTAAAGALRELERRVRHILVHFDVDVIDVDEFPAVDVPHKPGLGLAEARAALEVFLGSRQVAGLVVTEFNAGRDAEGRLARRLTETIVAAVTGGRASAAAGVEDNRQRS